MTWYTSASKLLAAMLVVCASTGARAAADEPEKSTLDQIKAALDELKQQQQTPYSKYTVNQGSLAIESWLLTSTAIDGTAEKIAAAIPRTAKAKKILVIGGTEPLDFGQLAMLDMEIQALTNRLVGACGCRSRTSMVAGAPLALAGAIAGLLKSETELTAIEQSVDAKLLAAAVALRLPRGFLPSAATAPADGGDLIAHFNALVNAADNAQSEADRLAVLPKPTAPQTDKLARLKLLLGRYDSFYSRVTTANSIGVVPLAVAARLQNLIAETSYVLHVNTEKAGGTLLKRTNLLTALGAESAFISGGLVSSYQLTSPNDGDVETAGVITCRTTLTSLKRVQQGSWISSNRQIPNDPKSAPIAVCSP